MPEASHITVMGIKSNTCQRKSVPARRIKIKKTETTLHSAADRLNNPNATNCGELQRPMHLTWATQTCQNIEARRCRVKRSHIYGIASNESTGTPGARGNAAFRYAQHLFYEILLTRIATHSDSSVCVNFLRLLVRKRFFLWFFKMDLPQVTIDGGKWYNSLLFWRMLMVFLGISTATLNPYALN